MSKISKQENMEETNNVNNDIPNISVAEIYEELKSNEFIEGIGLTVLADVKDTVIYKQIKDMIIRQFLNLASSNLSAVVELKKKQIESATIGYFAEILCSDLSKVIRSRLRKTYRPCFTDTVKKLLRYKSVTGSDKKFTPSYGALYSKLTKGIDRKRALLKKKVPRKFRNSQTETKPGKKIFDRLESISRGYAQNLEYLHSCVKKTERELEYVETSSRNHISNSIEASHIPKDLREKKINDSADNDDKTNEGKISSVKKRSSFSMEHQRLLNNEFESYMENIEIKVEPESDAESELSFELNLDDSVSSVHTSDLSSFDDTISISSEDEMGNKKRKSISLQEAKELYLDDKPSSSNEIKKQRKQNQKECHSI